MRKRQDVLNISALLGLLCVCPVFAAAWPSDLPVSELPFSMTPPEEPQIPDKRFVITDYGAVGDGQTMNTEAFARAMEACAKAGGGRVIVPAGLWLTGPIRLVSRMDLHLEKGAVILFSPNIEDYPLEERSFEGRQEVRRMSPLTGDNLEHIAITGSGILDGSGQAWRPVKKEKMTERQWKELVASGGAVEPSGTMWWPSEKAMNGPQTAADLKKRKAPVADYAAAGEFLRPVMVSLVNCRTVLLDGPTFQNSPAWNIHPLLCENMILRNLQVRNPWWSQNGDGLDLESCRNVLVYNCTFDVGDDAICMKSGRDEYGRRRGKPTENVVISDCIVYHGHGGFVVGSEMSGGVRNIWVRNCSFLETDIGLRFKSTRGRGGLVENIYIQDIFMANIAVDAIHFNLFYSGSAPTLEESVHSPAAEVNEGTPRFERIFIRNVFCRGAKRAVYMQGLPEMPVRDVEIKNTVISAQLGGLFLDTERLRLSEVSLLPEKGPDLTFTNSRTILLERLKPSASKDGFLVLAGGRTKDIRLLGANRSNLSERIHYQYGCAPDVLSWE
ncbi:MAG TPA: glycoside hydrolase family 28 protein [Anaerohalosphaeraceae bacterium]|nr:glycoside hydrolase family 28 protein [Anaerohalosphaeraceae bacterium]